MTTLAQYTANSPYEPHPVMYCMAPSCGDGIHVGEEVVMVNGLPWHRCCAEYLGREGNRGWVEHNGHVVSEKGEWLW